MRLPLLAATRALPSAKACFPLLPPSCLRRTTLLRHRLANLGLDHPPPSNPGSPRSSSRSSSPGHNVTCFCFNVNLRLTANPPTVAHTQPIELRFHHDWEVHPAQRITISFSAAGVHAENPVNVHAHPPHPQGYSVLHLHPGGDVDDVDDGNNVEGEERIHEGAERREGGERLSRRSGFLGYILACVILGLALSVSVQSPARVEIVKVPTVWRRLEEPERIVELVNSYAEIPPIVLSAVADGDLRDLFRRTEDVVDKWCKQLSITSKDVEADNLCTEVSDRFSEMRILGVDNEFMSYVGYLWIEDGVDILVDLAVEMHIEARLHESDPPPLGTNNDTFSWFNKSETRSTLDRLTAVLSDNATAVWVASGMARRATLDRRISVDTVRQFEELTKFMHHLIATIQQLHAKPIVVPELGAIWRGERSAMAQMTHISYFGYATPDVQVAIYHELAGILSQMQQASSHLDAGLEHFRHFTHDFRDVQAKLMELANGRNWEVVWTDADGHQVVEHYFVPRPSKLREFFFAAAGPLFRRAAEVENADRIMSEAKEINFKKKAAERRRRIQEEFEKRREEFERHWEGWNMDDDELMREGGEWKGPRDEARFRDFEEWMREG